MGLKDPIHDYLEIEKAARDEVMKNGGSISHHHGKVWLLVYVLGVGKIRKMFIKK